MSIAVIFGTASLALSMVFGAGTGVGVNAVLPAGVDLIQVTPEVTTVDVPAPGHEEKWEMTVSNVSNDVIVPVLKVDGRDSDLYKGPHPVEITVTEKAGKPVVTQSRVGNVIGKDCRLPKLAAGQSYHIEGTVAMPKEAGNEYQNKAGALTFRFVAEMALPWTGSTEDPSATGTPTANPVELSKTGFDSTTIFGAMALLLVGGFAMSVVGAAKKRGKEKDA